MLRIVHYFTAGVLLLAASASKGQHGDSQLLPREAADHETFVIMDPVAASENILFEPTPVEAPVLHPEPESEDWSYTGDSTRYAYISNGGDKGFGIQDLEFSLPWRKFWWGDAWPESMYEFHTSLDFNIHWWEGPQTPAAALPDSAPDLPPRVYDLSLHLSWLPRITDWLVADLAINPGLFTDFHTTPPEAFRWRGHAAGIVCMTNDFHLVGGIDYINRETVKSLPMVGVLWSPDCDTRCHLVFPHPRLSRRLARRGDTEWWGYVAGEYGGGAWAVHLEGEPLDYVEYNDLRIMVGCEWAEPGQRKGFVEVGYLFQREIHRRSTPVDFQPDDTFMIAIGWWR